MSHRTYTAAEYPNVRVKLVGEDGNAFAIIGRVKAALLAAHANQGDIANFMMESMSGDYNHLLATALKYVSEASIDPEPQSGEEDDRDDEEDEDEFDEEDDDDEPWEDER